MKKRIVITAAILMAWCGIGAFGWGIGIEGGLPIPGLGGLPGSNAMVTAKFDGLPLLGVGLGFNDRGLNNLGVIADWWLIQEPFAGLLGVYLGPGLWVSLVTSSQAQLALGGRLPIGLQIFPLKWFELFIEIAPAAGVVFYNNTARFDWHLQAAAGLRFWFNKK